jgi:hypothetical protein
MGGILVRWAAVVAIGIALAGCASGPDFDDGDSGRVAGGGHASQPDNPLQCVPYAREHSAVALYGDAYTWWDQATGRYARSAGPSEGAVMVLTNYAGPNRGHVAVVRELIDSRTIKVDHANWLDDGAIYTGDPVRDVSPENDWSQVRVFNVRTGAWGGRTYPVQGFIGPGPDTGGGLAIARVNPGRDAISSLIDDDETDDSALLR